MRINHNIAAMNTFRQLSQNNSSVQNSLEKLSSGLRINRAADDAAGLAISEKMRAQIRGLDQAQQNAQDGVSLIQTAEGALNETHSILQRMRELAVQSSNDTNTNADRAQIQKEVNQLAQEITRIGRDTEFNTQKLLDGSFEGTFQIGANEGQNISLSIGDMRAANLNVIGDVGAEVAGTYNAGTTSSAITDGDYTVRGNDTNGYELVSSEGSVVAESANGTSFTGIVDNTEKITFTDTVTSGTVTVDATTGNTAIGTTSVDNSGLGAGTYTVESDGSTIWSLVDTKGDTVATSSDGIDFKVEGNTVFTTTTGLVDGAKVTVGGIDVSTQDAANNAITTINNAIEQVSSQRSELGAYQNRLEHTINSLGTSSENLTAAESRIRDVDYADAA